MHSINSQLFDTSQEEHGPHIKQMDGIQFVLKSLMGQILQMLYKPRDEILVFE